jgi:hypothetical protein
LQQYPGMYTAARIAVCRTQLGRHVWDCVGLIKGIVWNADFGSKYQATSDLSANGMFAKCTVVGPIATLPEIPGLVLHAEGHIAIYEGGGRVIEARGFGIGVVRSYLKDRAFEAWGKCHLIDYSVAPAIDWQAKALAAQDMITVLNARIEQEIPALQTSVKELEGDRLALKTSLQKALN